VPRCGECPLAPTCPSRGKRFEPQRRQGPFEGSFRQRRARTLQRVAACRQGVRDLDADAVAALVRDGLVVVRDGFVELPGALEPSA
jgi:hypothetical protein